MHRKATVRTAIGAGLGVLFAATAANAGGFEYPENGGIAMGRGGAFLARADDPTALMLNTAGIMGAEGAQVYLGANVAFLRHCFTHGASTPGGAPNYDSADDYTIDSNSSMFAGTVFAGSNYANGSTPYPQVCNDNKPFVAPNVLFSYKINDQFAFGLGVYGPNSIGQNSWPTTVMTENGLAPSPTRYTLIDEDLLILHPTIALAAAPYSWLRLGVGLQPSFAQFQFTTMANANSLQAQSPDSDLQTHIKASGFFFAFNLGAQVLVNRYLTIGGHLHVNPTTIALSGDATTISNFYHLDNDPSRRMGMFHVDRLEAHLPIQARLGIRFAMPRSGSMPLDFNTYRGVRSYNSMRDDLFDIEVDGIYESSSTFTSLDLRNSGNIDVGGSPAPAPNLSVPHNWHDVWGVRAGGDVNIVPDHFAIRLGVSYETGAQGNQVTQLDIASYDSLGLHAGLSFRYSFLTVSLAYAHFIMSPIDVPADDPMGAARSNNLAVLGTTGPVTYRDCTSAGPFACHTNVGRFEAALDVLTLGLTGHF